MAGLVLLLAAAWGACRLQPVSLPSWRPPGARQELSNLLWSLAAMDYYPGASVIDAITRVGGWVGGWVGRARCKGGCCLYPAFRRCPLHAPLAAERPACIPPLVARPPAVLGAQAAGAAADRMKPQELANTAWAWATLRFFPGAALMDTLLAQAEAQLERFKSQELGNLCW